MFQLLLRRDACLPAVHLGLQRRRRRRGPLPMADTLWSFRSGLGQLVAAALETLSGETGLRLAPDTGIEFSRNHQAVELRVMVGQNGATIKAGPGSREGLPSTFLLPQMQFAEVVHVLKFTDPQAPANSDADVARVDLR